MDLLLAADTSAYMISVALGSAGNVIAETELVDAQGDALALAVHQLLGSTGSALGDVTGLIVGAGPGSFTGLRMGLSFIKGLALARRIPVRQVSSLLGYVAARKMEARLLIGLSDARRGELFFEPFRRTAAGKLIGLGRAEIVGGEVLEERIGAIAAAEDVEDHEVICLAAGRNLVELKRFRIEEARNVAGGLLLEGAEDWCLEEFNAAKLAAINPNYLRAVAALTIAERTALNNTKKTV